MFYLFLVIHILSALFLILVVLLQSGKAGDLSSAFGGASSQTAFGARGATTALQKATTAAAALFMIASLALSISYSSREESVIGDIPAPGTQQEAPAPAEQPPAPPQGEAQPEEGSAPATPPPSGDEGGGSSGQSGNQQGR